jgi:hypothetical protein
MSCPECGALLDAVTGVAKMAPGKPRTLKAEAKPREGDLTMCADCTQILKFGPGGQSLLALADAEFRALPDEQRALFHRMRRWWHEHPG